MKTSICSIKKNLKKKKSGAKYRNKEQGKQIENSNKYGRY